MISVVIPAYNAGRFIRRTIDSVLAQTYTGYEIIVVDDGSTDNTGDIVKNYGSKVRYIYQQNAGDGAARNTGIYTAKGEWIAFLDHDDEWLPEKLQRQMELLERNPQLHWCAANFYKQSGPRKITAGYEKVLRKALSGKDYFDNFFLAVSGGKCKFMTSTMMVHKQAFERAGVFDSQWMRCADMDMWWRIAYRFPSIGYAPVPLAVLHIGIQDVISTKLRMESKRGGETRELIAKHLRLVEENRMLAEFIPVARQILRDSLLTTIFRGYKEDARAIVREFRDLFPWYVRNAAYLLTIFPKATSATIKTVAYLRYKLGLERDITRRWIELKDAQDGNKEGCEH